MRDFLGAGDSFIPPDIVNDLVISTREIAPLKMLFPEWNNQIEAKEQRITDPAKWQRGALHIWREPIEGREYIIGVDSAEGMGDENDNNCFQVIDVRTCEQMAEFYSNECPPHNFSQIVAMVGKTYNNALIVVESMGAGLVVLEKLEREFYYENVYESTQGTGKQTKRGLKTLAGNRSKILEALQTRLLNRSIAIRSRRFAEELRGFIWNTQAKKAQASKGFHDDAIMALALSLYVRDEQVRQSPVSYDSGESLTEKFKAEIYQSIKEELSKGMSDNWLESNGSDWFSGDKEEDVSPSILFGIERSGDSILKEFGW
jgi:hypothetical protein